MYDIPVFAEFTKEQGTTNVFCGYLGRTVMESMKLGVALLTGTRSYVLGSYHYMGAQRGSEQASATELILMALQTYGEKWTEAWTAVQKLKAQTPGLRLVECGGDHVFLYQSPIDQRIALQSIQQNHGDFYATLFQSENLKPYSKFEDALSVAFSYKNTPTGRFCLHTPDLISRLDELGLPYHDLKGSTPMTFGLPGRVLHTGYNSGGWKVSPGP